MAQENSANDTTQTKVEAVTDSTSKEGENSSLSMENKGDSPVGIHKELKTKFIEGSAFFMSFVAIALVLGMAFCVERIIYLNLSEVDVDKLLEKIEKSLKEGNVEEAKEICRNTRGPVASIFYQGLMRLDQGVDVVEKSIISYGSVQGGLLERNLSWITLFIAMSPSLGFLGTVIGMVQAFDKIQQVGDISPTVVAGGMKVA
ncbi:MAG TPA: flagellar motor protein MotA, partial [Porphyromonadaceae bacterium]|nr:flagellar motor protein MotA [Porphyromonadaceae bacterium]